MADGYCSLDYHTEAGDATTYDLRILATTDMHMHVLPFDYLADRPSSKIGFARTASLIERLRREHPNTLLLDNGDFLEGSPMGEFVARVSGVGPRNPHPAIAAMNAIGYDAATLGNHDFGFGVGFLMRALQAAQFPFTIANVNFLHRSAPPRWLILDRTIRSEKCRPESLRIGIIGLLPPQTGEWNRPILAELNCDDMVEVARAEVPKIRAAGADIVIALAHSGIGGLSARPNMENAATALAALPGIDAIIAGHTHQVFPHPRFPAGPGVDPVAGTLAGKPAVMAGFAGSHVGVIDLSLRRGERGDWQIESTASRAEGVDSNIPASPAIALAAERPHVATRRHLRRRIARTETALTSYFALIGDDPGLYLVAKAQRWHVRRQLRSSKWRDLPILSASAPFRAGGLGGADHYTAIEPGRLTERNLAALYMFPNRVSAVEITGAKLMGWLQRAAGVFHQIEPGANDSPLIDPAFPSYYFDVIDGLTWQIDLSEPPQFQSDGSLMHPHSKRIRDIRHRGQPVSPDDRFILATNSFRLAACGLFAPLVEPGDIALDDDVPTRAVLRRYLRRRKTVDLPPACPWRFTKIGATAMFESSPEAVAYLPRVNCPDGPPRVTHEGTSSAGFAKFRVTL